MSPRVPAIELDRLCVRYGETRALEDVTLGSSAGKTRIIATVPSLDTPVCHAETKRFNDEAAKLGSVQVLVVSTDLPFGHVKRNFPFALGCRAKLDGDLGVLQALEAGVSVAP